MTSLFSRKKNRKAQAIAAGTTAVIATVATGGLGLIAVGVTAAAWWVTGKATEK